MNETLQRALREAVGDGLSMDGGRGVLRPAGPRELAAALAVLREHGAGLGEALTLSRSAFDAVLKVDTRSGVLEVGAGLTLEAIDRVARGHGLTVGALGPDAMRAPLCEFLEGRWAGLRAIPGGRLEPLSIAVTAILANGQAYQSPGGPRSATGPGLEALLLGGGARFGVIVSAALRLYPVPERTVRVFAAFSDPQTTVRALRRTLEDGALFASVAVFRRGAESLVSAELAGGHGAVERDASTLRRRAAEVGGRLIDGGGGGPVDSPEDVERELSWDDVAAHLAAGGGARLFRLALDSCLAVGGGGRADAAAPAGWSQDELWGAIAAAADPERVLGGMR